MKNVLKSAITYILSFVIISLILQTCVYEVEQNEIKNRQWVQDSKDGKPYTNYGE